MARPREFDVDDALDRATEVFWKRGYEATSVQDLVDALGVNRASLYATFGDKAQLFSAVIDRYRENVKTRIEDALAAPAAGAAAIRAWFMALIQMATQPRGPRGCLLVGSLSSCSTIPDALRDQILAGVRGSTDRLQVALSRDPEIAAREDVQA